MIYNDKSLYKLLAIIGFIFSMLGALLISSNYGIKGGLFFIWGVICIYLIAIFIAYLALKPPNYNHEKSLPNSKAFIPYYWIDNWFYGFKFKLFMFFLIIISVGVFHLINHLPISEKTNNYFVTKRHPTTFNPDTDSRIPPVGSGYDNVE